MRERLSSAWTAIAKFVLTPGLAILATAQTGWLLFTSPEPGVDPLTLNLWRGVVAVNWIVLMILLFKWGLCLTNVAIQEDVLIVSNYFREAEIPLSELESASGGFPFLFDLIWLRFRRDTEVGDHVVFMAKGRTFLWRRHPILLRLRADLVGLQEGDQPSMSRLRPGAG